MFPKAYFRYLILFHAARDYFECHDVLEDHWKKDPKGMRKAYWVGLIQIAVMLYHDRRGNRVGAKKMIKKALSNIEPFKKEIEELGIDHAELIARLYHVQTRFSTDAPYRDMSLPIKDVQLKQKCRALAEKDGWVWDAPSDLNNFYLIHKHKLRKWHRG